MVRTQRGCARLADEVGLGKTVGASMVLLVHQLCGMVGRVRVLAPPPGAAVGGELAGLTARGAAEGGWHGDGVVVSLAMARRAKKPDERELEADQLAAQPVLADADRDADGERPRGAAPPDHAA